MQTTTTTAMQRPPINGKHGASPTSTAGLHRYHLIHKPCDACCKVLLDGFDGEKPRYALALLCRIAICDVNWVKALNQSITVSGSSSWRMPQHTCMYTHRIHTESNPRQKPASHGWPAADTLLCSRGTYVDELRCLTSAAILHRHVALLSW